jgi:hypothetical protein
MPLSAVLTQKSYLPGIFESVTQRWRENCARIKNTPGEDTPNFQQCLLAVRASSKLSHFLLFAVIAIQKDDLAFPPANTVLLAKAINRENVIYGGRF